ncbi:unnamed protein product [marine sediment metagenome]|uniref:Uncharacterized protein n=1 Tax=marine sediment metagenome TaxID=412755 RepID=X1L4W5_9ZZZZ
MTDEDLSNPKKVAIPLKKWWVRYLRELVGPRVKSEIIYCIGLGLSYRFIQSFKKNVQIF